MRAEIKYMKIGEAVIIGLNHARKCTSFQETIENKIKI